MAVDWIYGFLITRCKCMSSFLFDAENQTSVSVFPMNVIPLLGIKLVSCVDKRRRRVSRARPILYKLHYQSLCVPTGSQQRILRLGTMEVSFPGKGDWMNLIIFEFLALSPFYSLNHFVHSGGGRTFMPAGYQYLQFTSALPPKEFYAHYFPSPTKMPHLLLPYVKSSTNDLILRIQQRSYNGRKSQTLKQE